MCVCVLTSPETAAMCYASLKEMVDLVRMCWRACARGEFTSGTESYARRRKETHACMKARSRRRRRRLLIIDSSMPLVELG